MRWILAPLALLALLALNACGYRVAGKGDLLPKNIKTIAVPAFANVTTRYKLTDLLPAAITREFISRTRYEVVTDVNQADAILTGVVANVFTSPTVFDPGTGRASGIQVNVNLQVTLRERESGKMLYNQPNMEFRQRYEIALDPKSFFDESGAALERLSRDVARTVVTGVLEVF
ncbi:MAG: LptE family protein [Bryobacteraceae bacterium]|nr:LptE family protein [Bryobacteraceae bacterium]